ncbi:nucleotide-binding universal stress UspA family protein [Williamsia limnetica]|uniref:Nucleotide-binding universal stress UspA family protein n=1 Tax=Williamsia limnetica TaxID=882452 RepID=A0A318RHJ3_WILLI|nr:universal stress protein [Williamsia limnetica]PYE12741.1 nucleotide-binding universal stress UspA family protein [Williamsia limnetica]
MYPEFEERSSQLPIVVGVDGSSASRQALLWAAHESRRRRTRLMLVPTTRPPVLYYGNGMGVWASIDVDTFRTDECQALLDEALTVAADVTKGAVAAEITNNQPTVQPVVDLIERSHRAQMIVLGAHGPGKHVGALARSVAAHSPCPVVILHHSPKHQIPATGPVVLGINDATTSAPTVEAAFEEASLRCVDLVVIHRWSTDATEACDDSVLEWALELEEYTALSEELKPWQQRFPSVTVRLGVVRTSARRALVEAASDAQLVVVGRRDTTWLGALRPTTATALLRRLECPLMIVHHS